MKTNGLTALAAASCAVLAGCALQQAPLVYSSKISVGVDVTSNPAETPGVSLNVGVKVVDAAYVPVAVASPASQSADQLLRIYAENGRVGDATDMSPLAQEHRARVDNYVQALKAADAASAAVRLAEQRLGSYKADLAGLAQAKGQLAAVPASAALPGELMATLKRIGDASLNAAMAKGAAKDELGPLVDKLIAAYQTKASEQDTQLPALREATTAKAKEAAALYPAAAQAAASLQSRKTDALSVFGRFDSSSSVQGSAASAPSATANVIVGKVFSTGLASQNLTEAVRVAAVGACIADALAASVRVASAASAASSVAVTVPPEVASAVASACQMTARGG